MKRLLSMLLIATMILSLAACGGSTDAPAADSGNAGTEQGAAENNADSGNSTEKTVITLWRHDGTEDEGKYYDAMIEAFNAQSDTVVIEQTIFPGATYVDQINAAIATQELPDVIDFDGVYMAGFVNYGALAPLDDYITDQQRADLLPSIFEEGTYEDGKVYMLGQFDSGLSFWGNRAHLEEAGVRIPAGADDAWDRAEFEDALAKLKGVAGVEYPLDMKINYGGGYWVYSYLPVVRSFGGDFIDRSTFTAEGTINGPETVAAFDYLNFLIDNGYINPTQSTDDDFYGTKTSSLALVGHWMYPTHKESLGDDAVLIPLPDFGEGVFTGSGSYGWGMTTKAVADGKADRAFEVLEYFMSAEGINGVFEANGAVPASKEVLGTLDEYKEGGMLYLYKEQLEKGKAYVRPVTPAFATIQDQVGMAAMSILSGGDVQEILDEVAEEIDMVIEDNGYHGK